MRIGLLVPRADVGPESELRAMAPPSVAIHAARVPFGAQAAGGGMDPTIPLAPVRAFAEPPHVDDAAELLAGAPLDAIAYGFTSSAYVIGAEAEAEMIRRLERRTRGIPVLAPCAAAVEGLSAFGISRIALVDPPWFDEELSELGRRYYESAGFEVVYSAPCDLPSDQTRLRRPTCMTGSADTFLPMPGDRDRRKWIPSGGSDCCARGRSGAPGHHRESSSVLGVTSRRRS